MDHQSSGGTEPYSAGDNISVDLEQLMGQAMAIGPGTGEYMSRLVKSIGLKEPMLGACRGILRLARVCGNTRIEAACWRGLQGSKYNLRVIKHILDNNLDKQPLVNPTTHSCQQKRGHENLRGEEFFT